MNEALAPRSVAHSRTVMTQLVFPEHANALGKAFGGQVMAWSDMAGGICSMRHSGGLTVTAAIDDLVFEVPLRIGDIAVVEARVNAAFRSSMEVEVGVFAERPDQPTRARCVVARFTFVAIDGDGAVRAVPPLALETPEEVSRAQEAAFRREERLARRRRQGTT
jgi:acyl-CoA hydrolase